MGNFQGGGNRGGGGFRGGGGGRPNFQKRSFGGDRQNTMFKAVCDECNKSCEVPFRPSSDKPVYCNECFSSKKDTRERPERKDFNNSPKNNFSGKNNQSFGNKSESQDEIKKQLSDINSKIANLTSMIENLLNKGTDNKKDIKSEKIVEKKVEKKKVTPVVKSLKLVKKVPAKKVLAKSKK